MDTKLLAFRTLYNKVKDQQHLDMTLTTLMFSTLVYFSEDFIYKIAGEIGATEVTVQQVEGIRFFSLKYRGEQFVSFRGTEASLWSNWKRILNFIPKRSYGNRKAHRGFIMALEDCQNLLIPLINQSKSVIFTGHSLGGALAILATERFGGTAITYASPQVFFREKVLNKISYIGYRVIGDFVPHLPPTILFLDWSRAKPEFWTAYKSWFINPFGYHRVSTYITVMMEYIDATSNGGKK